MSDLIQGRAVILLGPDPGDLTDYSCWISEFTINETRSQVVKPPSFGSPQIEQLASAGAAQVTMSFLAVPDVSSGLWNELQVAARTLTGELYFEYQPAVGSVSPANPKKTGYIVVTDIDMGAPAASPRRQRKTFPARAVSQLITS